MARELAQKRLEAAQSKFEVGMATNFEVVQAQRDFTEARNNELRADARTIAGRSWTSRRRRVSAAAWRSRRSAGGVAVLVVAVSRCRCGLKVYRKVVLLIVAVVALAGFVVYNRSGDAAARRPRPAPPAAVARAAAADEVVCPAADAGRVCGRSTGRPWPSKS